MLEWPMSEMWMILLILLLVHRKAYIFLELFDILSIVHLKLHTDGVDGS